MAHWLAKPTRSALTWSARWVALLGIATLSGCGDSPAARPASTQPVDGIVHLFTLNRLQAYAEGIPCTPEEPAPLAAAAQLRDEARAAGKGALLLAIGDTLVPTDSLSLSFEPVIVSQRARAQVLLEALGAAGVDLWMPGHADLQGHFTELLDGAKAAGVPVLISNIEVDGRDDVLPWLVLESGTLRLGLLGFLATRIGTTVDGRNQSFKPDYPGARVRPLVDTAQRLAKQLRAEQGVHLVVALSSLNQEGNLRLSEVEDIDVVLGSTELGFPAGQLLIGASCVQTSALPEGQEVAETILAVRNGLLNLADLSARHTLPAIVAGEQADLDLLMQRFGTSDIAELARLASPDDEDFVLRKERRAREGREFLAETENYQGSFIDHHRATLPPRREHDPVLAVLARQGAAIQSAYASAALKPPPPPSGELLIPLPSDCRACHVDQFRFWEQSPHAQSYASLQVTERGRDASCLTCHTTAFNDPNGYFDPRYDAPLGPVSCYSCHLTTALHTVYRRSVFDTRFTQNDESKMSCEACHTDRRSPGFDRKSALDRVRCPPMRHDDPVLLEVRRKAVESMETRAARGETDDPREPLLYARGLMSLGRVEEASSQFLKLAAAETADRDTILEIAQQLEEIGQGRSAVQTLRTFLAKATGDPEANYSLLKLLIESRDPTARNPAEALAILGVLVPEEEEGQPELGILRFLLLRVDALRALGRPAQAQKLLNQLFVRYPHTPELNEYLPGARTR